MTSKGKSKAKASKREMVAPIMSERELARLGDGKVGYIRAMSTEQAHALYPGVQGLPKSGLLFALHGADGTPIALTDSRQAAIGHAIEVELSVTSLH